MMNNQDEKTGEMTVFQVSCWVMIHGPFEIPAARCCWRSSSAPVGSIGDFFVHCVSVFIYPCVHVGVLQTEGAAALRWEVSEVESVGFRLDLKQVTGDSSSSSSRGQVTTSPTSTPPTTTATAICQCWTYHETARRWGGGATVWTTGQSSNEKKNSHKHMERGRVVQPCGYIWSRER